LVRGSDVCGRALMKYHTAKMDEINKIVKELWQQTYRGQDIDTIEIHADQGDATKARSYNYRVRLAIEVLSEMTKK